MKILPIALLATSLTGCASIQKLTGHIGQTLDSATTSVAIYGANMSEGNPILAPIMDSPVGNVGLWVGKMAIFWGVLFLPKDQCEVTYQAASGLGWGAAIHNVAILLGAAAPPMTAVVFAVSAVYAGVLSEKAADEWCANS
jgi:hypothetical protein